MSTPPAVGKGLSVKVDQELYDDLAVMLSAGMTLSEAVRHAVSIVAGTYRNAWESGRIPEGVLPQITHCMVRRYDGPRAVGNTPGGRGAQKEAQR
ncbi:hypothetical protein PV439_19660 [Streptomyces scabiei]|uniref:hypothetical protein n=1 Tax=Streptomyces scabiei TaxID=1930 RepID=UPI0029908190|nr:hypothetical protein [Streptomyces scabiei]MDW8804603.1 hypothetical protein [Streptomyces scabiei]MDX2652317.1 hypothetical protein [Streptomyces scabiei]MDX2869084.1 hypothetical protein [Streptomyces scabiei]MDX2889678.1 hypothetical protein [Streptomyces scabiei]MDX2893549.1 hypothetical protein [Streptomyces scabiei]